MTHQYPNIPISTCKKIWILGYILMIHFKGLIPPILQRLQPKRTLAEDFNVWGVSLSSTGHSSIPARDKSSLATVALRIKKSKVTATSKPESAKPAKKVPKCLSRKQCLGKCMKKKLVGSRIHGMGSVFFLLQSIWFFQANILILSNSCRVWMLASWPWSC